MRTNIEIDDNLITQAQQLTGIQTKQEVVEEALRLLIQTYTQVQVKDLRGRLSWEGGLDSLREGRFGSAR
jgi:Arc/MetJ family transcription regulator